MPFQQSMGFSFHHHSMALQGPTFTTGHSLLCSEELSCLASCGRGSGQNQRLPFQREKNLNIAERHKDCSAFSDQASLSSCLPRCCLPLGSSCCCFSEPILAPSHRMLLMPELSNQLCSSCEHGSALLQIATWKTATDSRQSLAFAWHNLGFAELLLLTESSGTCRAQGRRKILQGSENSKAGVSEQGRWRSALLPEQNQNHLILPKHTVLLFWGLNEQ